ncbi:hypothetical protein U0070_009546 [Myodes glareolus]|uniref:Uncharacterized protein n=1 Tax=Myodes glareolus TaxID=447135 RepID=A0AAW0H8B8_MYOGA
MNRSEQEEIPQNMTAWKVGLYRMTKITDEHGDKQDGDTAPALWVLWLGPCYYANPPGSNLQQDSQPALQSTRIPPLSTAEREGKGRQP